jgi:hypothetical protein
VEVQVDERGGRRPQRHDVCHQIGVALGHAQQPVVRRVSGQLLRWCHRVDACLRLPKDLTPVPHGPRSLLDDGEQRLSGAPGEDERRQAGRFAHRLDLRSGQARASARLERGSFPPDDLAPFREVVHPQRMLAAVRRGEVPEERVPAAKNALRPKCLSS